MDTTIVLGLLCIVAGSTTFLGAGIGYYAAQRKAHK